MDKKEVERIKQKIILQSADKEEDRWSKKELEEEMEIYRKRLQQLLGMKDIKDEDVLARLVSEYDEFEVEELNTKADLGERTKYTEINLDDYPSEESGGKAFDDLFRGSCLAGLVAYINKGQYQPQGMDKKVPKYSVYVADETDEFKVTVYGKNESVIKQWYNIQVGDYVEFSCVKVVEAMELNEDFDDSIAEDPDDNPKFVGTGKPTFRFMFGSENLQSTVQKISRDKYPELPIMEEYFAVDTMRIFNEGGRYIVNGVLLKIDKDISNRGKRIIQGWFIVQIGKETKKVNATFKSTSTEMLPKKDVLSDCRLKVLGYYNNETNVFKIDKTIDVIKETLKLNNSTKRRKVKKTKKEPPQPEKEESVSLEDNLGDVLQTLLEDYPDQEEFRLGDLIAHGLLDEFEALDVLHALEARNDVEVTDKVFLTFKFTSSEDEPDEGDSDETEHEDNSPTEVEAEDPSEQQPEKRDKEIVKAKLLENVQNVSNPDALVQFTNMSNQLNDIEYVRECFTELVEDNTLEYYEGNEKVRLKKKKGFKTVKTKKPSKTKSDDELYYASLESIRAFIMKSTSKRGVSLNDIKRKYPGIENVDQIMSEAFSTPIDITTKDIHGEIRNFAPNRWRFIKTAT